MSDTLKLSVLTPERRLAEGVSVSEVTLTGNEGQIQILPGHAPMVGSLDTGSFRYRVQGGAEEVGVISSGFFEIHGDELTLLAETLELKTEIDAARAKRAQQQAEDVLKSADLDEHRFAKYQLKLQRAMIRQQIAGREFH